jgi:hypothetical protein
MNIAFKASALSRDQFISWLGNSFLPRPSVATSSDLKNLTRQGTICLVWELDRDTNTTPDSRPLILIPDQQVRDFFSFVTTFVSNYQPFSAFFRVVRLSAFLELSQRGSEQPSYGIHRLVGAIIGETRSQLGSPRRELSDISIQACLASLSFPSAAGMHHGVSHTQLVTIMENWTKAKIILSDDPLPVSGESIARLWRIVSYANSGLSDTDAPASHKDIAELVFETAVRNDDESPSILRRLTERLPKSRAALLRLRDSREERVRAMDVIGQEIASSPNERPEIAEALLGYAASRVAGSSLRYFSLLQDLEQRFPLAPIWFGLFCSLRPESDAMVAAECLGRRVARHLGTPREGYFSPPLGDISFDEFVISTSTAKPQKWRTEHSGSISIELFPGIISAFRLGARSSSREVDESEPTIAIEAVQEMRFLATRLLRTLDDIDVPPRRRSFSESKGPSYSRKTKRP